MDQNMKNFDRNIEQMMNEHEVAPPFGMWNRISSELEAMPLPVAAAAPVVTRLIPKRAFAGIIAGALLLGTTIVTGYLVNSSLNNDNSPLVTYPVSVPTHAIAGLPVNETAPVAKHAAVAAIPVVKEIKINHINDDATQATLMVAQQVNPTGIVEKTQCVCINCGSGVINSNTDVPAPIEPVKQIADNQTFYFPPIDVTTPEKTAAPAISKSAVKPTVDDDNSAKPSSSGERKFRIKSHRRPWNYSSINKTR